MACFGFWPFYVTFLVGGVLSVIGVAVSTFGTKDWKLGLAVEVVLLGVVGGIMKLMHNDVVAYRLACEEYASEDVAGEFDDDETGGEFDDEFDVGDDDDKAADRR